MRIFLAWLDYSCYSDHLFLPWIFTFNISFYCFEVELSDISGLPNFIFERFLTFPDIRVKTKKLPEILDKDI